MTEIGSVIRSYLSIYIIGFVVASVLALLLTREMRTLAVRYGLLDVPDGTRRKHTSSVPRGGGIPLFISVAVALTVALWMAPPEFFASISIRAAVLPAIIAGGVAMLLLGFFDDLYDLPAHTKFFIETLVAIALWVAGVRIDIVNLAGQSVQVHTVLSLGITILWIVGITNAFNLIDGSDGIAAGAALFASLTMALIALLNGNPVGAVMSLAIAGAAIGFLWFNFPPASIFLGDSGSLFLGYSMAALGILTAQKATTLVAVAIPVVSCGLPILDAALTLSRRFLRRQPLFAGDRGHIHHRLQDLGQSPRQVAFVLYAVSAAFALLSLLLVHPATGPIIGIFIVAGVVAILAIQRLRIPELLELHRIVDRGLNQRAVIANNLRVREASFLIGSATTVAEIESALSHAFAEGEFARVELTWLADGPRTALHLHIANTRSKAARLWEIALPFRDEHGRTLGSLTLWPSLEADHLLTDLRLIAEELQPALLNALSRSPLVAEERRLPTPAAERRIAGAAAKAHPGIAQAS